MTIGAKGLRAKALSTDLQTWVDLSIEEGLFPGALVAVGDQHDFLVTCAGGNLGLPYGTANGSTSVFRIYSMSKPLTALATLRLRDLGKLSLNDPISKFLPIYERTSTIDGKPVGGELQIRNLLNHTSGIGGGHVQSNSIYSEKGIQKYDHQDRSSLSEFVQSLSESPLMNPPGCVWEYGLSYDLLGRVLEVAAGQSIDELLNRYVFCPLGMIDTAFGLNSHSLERLVDRNVPYIIGRPSLLSAGTGLYSTLDDYSKFLKLLLNGGVIGGHRLIRENSIREMFRNQISGLEGSGPDYIPGTGFGYGYGLAVPLGQNSSSEQLFQSPYWWLGRASTCFAIDRQHGVFAVLLTHKVGHARRVQMEFLALLKQIDASSFYR